VDRLSDRWRCTLPKADRATACPRATVDRPSAFPAPRIVSRSCDNETTKPLASQSSRLGWGCIEGHVNGWNSCRHFQIFVEVALCGDASAFSSTKF